MEANKYYSYALDENRCLIDAHDAQKGNEYFCPSCGSIMIPKQGKIRAWHFAHKVKEDKENCSYETYLHKLAKEKIRKCFLESEKFEISFSGKEICNTNQCPLDYSPICSNEIEIVHDLKESYDNCEKEVRVGEFCVDLLLIEKDNGNRQPVFIEVCVTHTSTEKKLNSKYRIIEIHITSEQDIENIVSTKSIVEKSERSVRDRKSVDDRILFYNFEKTITVSPRKLQEGSIYIMGCLEMEQHDTEDSGINNESRRCPKCQYSNGGQGCQLYKIKGIAPFANIDKDASCHYFSSI